VYSKFIEYNTTEISGVLVGSNTIGSNEANRSNTEVHERSLDFKISQSDRRNIGFNINDELLPLLQTQGYSYISDDDVYEWIESKEEIDLIKFWEIVKGIMEEFDVDEEWLSKTFNVPITGKKQTQSNNQIVASAPIMEAILKLIKNEAIQNPEQKDIHSTAKPWERDYSS
jgi:hypothetical protein